jgi:hypothetical protein
MYFVNKNESPVSFEVAEVGVFFLHIDATIVEGDE